MENRKLVRTMDAQQDRHRDIQQDIHPNGQLDRQLQQNLEHRFTLGSSSPRPEKASDQQLGLSGLLDRLSPETPVVFFEHLMRKLDQLTSRTVHTATSGGAFDSLSNPAALDPKVQWLCYLGLRLMHAESLKSRFERDIVALQATWKMLEPLLRDAGILFASKNDPDSDCDTLEMIERFLANEPPLLQTLPRHQARALSKKRASKRRRQIAKTFELQTASSSVSMNA